MVNERKRNTWQVTYTTARGVNFFIPIRSATELPHVCLPEFLGPSVAELGDVKMCLIAYSYINVSLLPAYFGSALLYMYYIVAAEQAFVLIEGLIDMIRWVEVPWKETMISLNFPSLSKLNIPKRKP